MSTSVSRRKPAALEAPLLELFDVHKRYRDGGREIVVLDRISFELRAGASLGLYGERRSGKSTLLRLAAALEEPDGGRIRFAGCELAGMTSRERAQLLRGPVALLSQEAWMATPGETAIDHVAMAVGSSGLSLREARRRALAALDDAGVAGTCAHELIVSIGSADRARVMLARALVREPRLLLVDEPAPLPSLLERDRFCALLRALARERGIAMLVSSEDISALQGLQELASISGGELCFTEQRGTIVEFPRRRAATFEPP